MGLVKGENSLFWGTGLDTTGLEKGAKKAHGILADFRNKISKMDVFAVLSAAATHYTKKIMVESTKLAARYETLGAVIATVGDNAGYSADRMAKLQKSVEITGITMIQARQNLIRMAQAQLDMTKASELARVAQDAAVIGNVNSSEAFERVIHGITTGMPRVLRQIGIVVDFQHAYEEAAEAVGKSAEDFTMMEKTQIRMNAVLEAGTRIAGSYEAAMDTAGKKALSLARYVENIKVQLGMFFQPAYIKSIDFATAALSKLLKMLDKTSKTTFEVIAESGSAYIRHLEKEKSAINSLAGEVDKLSKIKKPTIKDTKELTEAEKQLSIMLGEDFSTAVRSATSGLDLYNQAKEKSIDLDKKIIEMQLEVAEAELETMKIQKQLYALQEDTITGQLTEIAHKRNKISQRITTGVLGIAGQVDVGFDTKARTESIEAETEKVISGLKEEGIVIAGMQEKLVALNEQKFKGIDVSKEERDILKEILDKSSKIKQYDLQFREIEVKRTAEIKKQSLEIEILTKKIERLRRGEKDVDVKVDDIIDPTAGMTQKEKDDWIISRQMMMEEQDEEQRKLDQEYQDWRISNSEELIKADITAIEAEMAKYDERTNYARGHYDALEKRQAQLATFEKKRENTREEERRQHLNKLLKDFRNYNKEKLAAYKKELEAELSQEGLTEEEKVMLRKEKRDVDKEIFDDDLKNLRAIGDGLKQVSGILGDIDATFGATATKIGDIVSSYVDMKAAEPGSIGQISAGLGALSTFESIMNSFSKIDNSNEKLINSFVKFDRNMRRLTDTLRLSMGLEKLETVKDIILAETEKEKAAYAAINNLVAYSLTGGRTKSVVDLLKEKNGETIIEDLISGEANITEDILMLSGNSRYKIYEKDVNALIDIINQSHVTLSEYESDLKEMLTGTTAESIAESISSGLSQGLDSVQDFADDFESIMRKSITDAFERDVIDIALKPFYDEFALLAEDGLTKQEIDTLRQLYTTANNDIKGAWDALANVGIDLTPGEAATKQGLAGSIAGVSEQTAGMLAGTMNGILTNVVQSKAIQTRTNEHFLEMILHADIEIRDNTYWNDDIYKKNVDMNDNLSVMMQTGLDNLSANQETAVNTRRLRNIDINIERMSGAGVRMFGV